MRARDITNGLLRLSLVLLVACDDQQLPPADVDEMGVTRLASGSSGLTEEELLDPTSCQPCHPTHYDEWSRSVHAHASTSPIFQALNALGQRDTEGRLGKFCVQCHAPVAVALGETEDGLNIQELPARSQGITCAYCHQITEVVGTHNNQLTWTRDGVMRGRLSKPVPSRAHRSMYSPLHDGRERASSDLCGACHDIVTPTGVHLERTYLEWSQSIYADPDRANSCIDCHMPSRSAEEIALGVRSRPETRRRHHNHLTPAVDLVIPTEHSEQLAQIRARSSAVSGESLRDAVERELNLTLLSELCAEVGVEGGADVELYLENISAGHRFPSGAALDRRLWVELNALDARGEVVYSSGAVPPESPASDVALNDPLMWLMRDRAFDLQAQETHHFWEVDSVERATLPPSRLENTEGEEPHVLHRYRFGSPTPIREIQVSVYLRPIALEVLYELLDAGLLSRDVIDQMPQYELRGARKVWRVEESVPLATRSGRTLLCAP